MSVSELSTIHDVTPDARDRPRSFLIAALSKNGSRSSTITRLGKSARSLQGDRSRHAQACAVRIAVRVTDRLFESCKDRTNRGCIRHAPIDWNCKADTDRAVPSVRRSIDFTFKSTRNALVGGVNRCRLEGTDSCEDRRSEDSPPSRRGAPFGSPCLP